MIPFKGSNVQIIEVNYKLRVLISHVFDLDLEETHRLVGPTAFTITFCTSPVSLALGL